VKALLDTHTFLWWISDDARLSARVKRLIADPKSDIIVSYGSLWEMTIKIQKGALKVPGNSVAFLLSEMEKNAFRLLPLRSEHLLRLESLKAHHRDPFDRLLIAQAMEEDIPMLTKDSHFHNYPVKVIW
jgi:PIN domain nuclease of toxin-antitoxin system